MQLTSHRAASSRFEKGAAAWTGLVQYMHTHVKEAV